MVKARLRDGRECFFPSTENKHGRWIKILSLLDPDVELSVEYEDGSMGVIHARDVDSILDLPPPSDNPNDPAESAYRRFGKGS